MRDDRRKERNKMKKTLTELTLFLVVASLVIAFLPTNSMPGSVNQTFSYDDTVYTNPLKGFMPYRGIYDSFPYSLEFFYVPLRDLMVGPSNFTFESGIEPQLTEIGDRGHQAVFRVYLDYPDVSESGVPLYLMDGLTFNHYDDYGGGASPDYTNETLVNTLVAFVGKLGELYDGDPRIGFIQVGLLGFWGEWHTYPHESWFAPETVQSLLLETFDQAFDQTHIMVRYPAVNSPNLDIGYHDDSFAYETIGEEDWQFLNLVKDAEEEDKWENYPIGGEVYPPLQETIWSDHPDPDTQDFDRCVEETHVSWLLNHDLFETDLSESEKESALEGSRMLGYEFFIKDLSVFTTGEELVVGYSVQNTGVAPYYYPIQPLVKLVGNYQKVEAWGPDLRSLLPGEKAERFEVRFSTVGLSENSYSAQFQLLSTTFGNLTIHPAVQGRTFDGKVVLPTFTLDSLPSTLVESSAVRENMYGFIVGLVLLSGVVRQKKKVR